MSSCLEPTVLASWLKLSVRVQSSSTGRIPDSVQIKALLCLSKKRTGSEEPLTIGEPISLELQLGDVVKLCPEIGTLSPPRNQQSGKLTMATELVVLPLQSETVQSVHHRTTEDGFDQSVWPALCEITKQRLLSAPTWSQSLLVSTMIVHGPRGSGKTSMIYALSQKFQCSLVEINAKTLYGMGNSMDEHKALKPHLRVRDKFKEALATPPSIILVDNAEQLMGESLGESDPNLLIQMLDSMENLSNGSDNLKTILIFVTSDIQRINPLFVERVDELLQVVMPSLTERQALLEHMISFLPNTITVEAGLGIANVVQRMHGYVAQDVELLLQLVCDNAHLQVRPGEEVVLNASDFNTGVGQYKPVLLRGKGAANQAEEFTLIRPNEVKVGFQDIGGLENVKQFLSEMVVWPVKLPHLLDHFGVEIPRGIILYGPPGTGKTLLARAVAKEASANFLNVSISSVIQGHIGESERVISRVFQLARRCTPCIVFFDEFQALFGSRSSVGNVGRKLVSQLLLEMDSLCEGVVLMGATNAVHAIDDALLRPGRFDRHVQVGLPDLQSRRQILQLCRDRMGSWDPSVDVQQLAHEMEGLSGAEIDSLCQQAGLRVLERVGLEGDIPMNTTIRMADILEVTLERFRT